MLINWRNFTLLLSRRYLLPSTWGVTYPNKYLRDSSPPYQQAVQPANQITTLWRLTTNPHWTSVVGYRPNPFPHESGSHPKLDGEIESLEGDGATS